MIEKNFIRGDITRACRPVLALSGGKYLVFFTEMVWLCDVAAVQSCWRARKSAEGRRSGYYGLIIDQRVFRALPAFSIKAQILKR